MSAYETQTSILDYLRRDSYIEEEFSISRSGKITTNLTAVSGTDTQFTIDFKAGDYIGNATGGYRKIVSIADNDSMVVDEEFDVELTDANYRKCFIRRGAPKINEMREHGRSLGLAYVKEEDIGEDLPGLKQRVLYGFVVFITFYEPDDDTAELRKSAYSKIIKDAVDKDPTFGDSDNVGITVVSEFGYKDIPEMAGLYIGFAPVAVLRFETRGDR